MVLIAGVLDLDVVMANLSRERPIFHSEADFQHAFGQAIHDLEPSLNIRLEMRQADAEYLDLFCFGESGRTAIEFKYVTAAWAGVVSANSESFRLRSHAADDLARRNFIFDIERLERFGREGQCNGLAIMLTNMASLWLPPSPRVTRDREFRIHEARTLTGTLRWGGGTFQANQRDLAGTYDLIWKDYSHQDGRNGIFRRLSVEVPSAPGSRPNGPVDVP